MITDYASLKSQISDQLERTDLAPYVDTLIQLAEGFLFTEPRLLVREAEAIETLSPTSSVYTLPTDFGGFREAYANTSPVQPLNLVESRELRTKYPYTSSGHPRVCSIIGSSLYVKPATTATVDLIYYRKATALSDANTTNWLLDAFPHVYLFASLAQAESFVKDDERVALWAAMMNTALDQIKKVDRIQRFGRATTRNPANAP
jgi:hypothetical protein